ncbi:macrolide family glycosyltransferase [Streptomyces sp. NPDC001056]
MRRHIAFIGRDGTGHVNPTLPMVAELVRRGHRVTYAVSESFADTVREAGARPLLLPNARFRHGGRSGEQALRRSETDVVAMVADLLLAYTERELPVLREGFAADRPDVICYDANSLAGAVLACLLGVPAVQIRPSFAANDHYTPLQEFVPDPERLTASLQAADARVREYASAFGVTDTLGTILTRVPGDLALVCVPRPFQYAGDTFDDRYVFIGPSAYHRTESGSWTPPPAGTPLLFISLGTLMNETPEFFRLCIDAFGDTDRHVAMAVGDRAELPELGALPDNFEIRPFFPQLDVLEHATGFVTHGGMNSAMEAVLRRVPTVAVPQMPEQRGTARRMEELGLGVTLADQTAPALRHAVLDAERDEGIRKSLADMAEVLQAAGGARAAADAVEKLLLG